MKFILRIPMFALFLIYSNQVLSAPLYAEDFEGSPVDLSNWSVSTGGLQVTYNSNTNNHVLGSNAPESYGTGFFNNDETVSLSLGTTAAGYYSVAFDFYAIWSWDGQGNQFTGPDKFIFKINGTDIFNENIGFGTPLPFTRIHQFLEYTYTGPVNDPPIVFPGKEFIILADVYAFEFLFMHPGGNLDFAFQGDANQHQFFRDDFPDEPWALDNIVFDRAPAPVPAPPTVVLLGIGLIGLVGASRKGKSRVIP